MFDFLFGGQLGGAFGDPRALSEQEMRALETQLGWAAANAKISWVGLENYRPPAPIIPPLPPGWADWYACGDLLQ